MATLRDIARACGVAVSTVSIALRGDARVHAETRENILREARRLGYRSDPLLSALSARRWQQRPLRGTRAALGFLSFEDRSVMREKAGPTWYLYRWSEATAAEYGYPLTWVGREERTDDRWVKRLHRLGVRGLVLGPLGQSDDYPPKDQIQEFSLVQAGLGEREPAGLPTCAHDVFNGVTQAYEQLRARGYRRIGPAIFRHPFPLLDDDWRYGAVFAQQEAWRLSPGEEPVPPLRSHPTDREAFWQWFHQHRPDAIIALHGLVSYWLEMEGIRLVEDVGLVLLNLEPGRDEKGRSGLWQPREAIARAAVQLLDHAIRHDLRGPRQNVGLLLLNPLWEEGHSVRPRIDPAR